MKSDDSIYKITVAAVNRAVLDIDTWTYSKIINETDSDLIQQFKLIDNELAIFEIKSLNAHTLITTKRILEKINGQIKSIEFDDIDDVVYGNFKGQIDKPELSKFKVLNVYGENIEFQMETGKASIGLIKSIQVIHRITREG